MSDAISASGTSAVSFGPAPAGHPHAAAGGARPPPLTAGRLLALRGADADALARRYAAERHSLRLALGTLAQPLASRRMLEALGFRSLGDYARERLGVSARIVREWVRVVDALAALPRMRAAVVSGEVSWSVARRAVAHATPEHDAAFVAALRGRSVRAAEALLAAAFGEGAQRATPGPPAEARVHLRVRAPEPERTRWVAAIELARRMAGESLPVWECAEAVAAETLSALPAQCVERAASGLRGGPAAGEDARVPDADARGAPAARLPDSNAHEHGLRHLAFPAVRWDRAGRVPHSDPAERDLERIARWVGSAPPHALDRALRQARRRLQQIDHDLGHLLRQVLERRLHLELGFPTFARWVEERIDVSPRTARRWIRLARLGPAESAVGRALREGTLTLRQAEVIVTAVPPDATAQAEALALARTVTLRRLEDELAATQREPGTISFVAPREVANVFLLALEAARLHTGARLVGAALSWMLDHALAAWAEQGAQFEDYADFTRDGFRCTAPGCTARRNLHAHHIVFRSAGGPDEPWNRTTLCAFHHLRGVHAGTVSCRGRAPDGLVFALGVRASGPPLLRAASGDVLLPS